MARTFLKLSRATLQQTSAKQKRSLRTEDKLLAAAIQVLDQEGLDGATVPRIAQQAKLSPASIYRRFVDKESLLRAAFLRVLGETNLNNERRLRSLLVRDSLPETVTALVSALLRQYRDHPRLLRALIRMLDIEPGSEFAMEAKRRIEVNLSRMAEVLLAHRAGIRHTNPELAALAEDSLWSVALPMSDKEFVVELARQMITYLVGPASH
jgi:AcrR family transcriptional regulator